MIYAMAEELKTSAEQDISLNFQRCGIGAVSLWN